MDYATRQALYRRIERTRKSKVLAFVTGDRPGLETQIAQDSVPLFVDLLDEIGPTKKISLILHTNGGQTSAAWRLVNLIRTFCDDLEVIVPVKALSSGTLISLGANRIVMTKQAALGPIDPSLVHALSPTVNAAGQQGVGGARVPVSVEAVRGYLDHATNHLKITDQAVLGNLLVDLAHKIHPLVLGEIFRTREQIRFLANKLLHGQVSEEEKKAKIIDFLCADSGSHDYTINRREAHELGLNTEKPSAALYTIIRELNRSVEAELKTLEPYSPDLVLGAAMTANYLFIRGLIESTAGGSHRFVSEGTFTRAAPNQAVNDRRTFEGWRKL